MENSIKTAAQKPADTNILGYEKIGKLLRIYAIPSIVSMLVNALYNIVDQIFIGQGIGYLGTGASLAFLLSIVLLVGELRSIGRMPQEQLDS